MKTSDGEADAERQHADRDLLADRVGGHRRSPAAVPAKTFVSSACCTPAPCGVNGTAADTAFTPSTSSTFFTEPPTLKASSSIQKAAKRKHQPPELHEEHLADVALAVLEDREALAHALPERLGAHAEQREAGQPPDARAA